MVDTMPDGTVAAENRTNDVSDTSEVKLPRIGGSLLMVFFFLLVQGLVALSVGLMFGQSLDEYSLIAWSMFATDLVLFLLLYQGLRAKGGVSAFAVGVRIPTIAPRHYLALVVALFAVCFALDELYSWYLGEELQQDIREIFTALMSSNDPVAFSMWIFAVVIGAPIIEEFIFRGYLQTALVKKLGAFAGILIASIIFAAIHFDLQAFPILFVAGASFGFLYHKSKSLLPSILLHLAMNIWASAYYIYF